MSPRPQVKLDTRIVRVNQLAGNPWNVNILDGRAYEAARESIRVSGFVDPVTVREHPREPECFEIIDGEHRWKAAMDEGMEEIAVNVLVVPTEADARKLTLQLNNKGTADPKGLADELDSLKEIFGDDLLLGLPFGEPDDESAPGGDGDGAEPEGEITTLRFTLGLDAADIVEQALARCMIDGESDDRALALERICADYLAGCAAPSPKEKAT